MPRVQSHAAPKVVRDFIKQVEAKMTTANIGVAELAALTGLSRQYIYRVLNGEHVPTLTVAANIASKLGLQIATVDAA